ncbi:MAG: M20/M25/M40 family metallo-hydrolase [Acidobacteriota bacterium]
MSLAVDQVRLAAELIALGEISEHPSPVVTRVVFTEADLRGREYVNGLCREAGLEIRQDAVGNTFATWAGSDRTLAPVGTGSHIDAIPNAGKYDGTAGVLGGLEAIRTLQRAGIRPRRSIELVTFTSEEPTRFGIGCLGSRMLGGFLGAEVGQRLRDRDGVTLDDARTTTPVFMATSRVSRCLPDTFTPSRNCTLNKAPSSKPKIFLSASSKRSPRLPG